MLIYCLVKGLPVNVGAIFRKIMLKFRQQGDGVSIMEVSSLVTLGS